MRQYDDLLIDALLDHGFTLEEAESLISLQERVERERQEQDREQWSGGWHASQGCHGRHGDPQ
ncbi:MAG: hypothetical protein PVSMB4_07880 [Ktedonobacterales bacterium]